MNTFVFELKQVVRITESGEVGTVIARADYAEAVPSYLVRYKNHQGIAVEQWWSQNALDQM